MKKLFALCVAGALLSALAGCEGSGGTAGSVSGPEMVKVVLYLGGRSPNATAWLQAAGDGDCGFGSPCGSGADCGGSCGPVPDKNYVEISYSTACGDPEIAYSGSFQESVEMMLPVDLISICVLVFDCDCQETYKGEKNVDLTTGSDYLSIKMLKS